AGTLPINVVPPELSGTPAVGSTLSCSPGTWNGTPEPSYAYRWKVNGTVVTTASASTLTVVSAYRGLDIVCVVTASNREGSAEAESGGVVIQHAAPRGESGREGTVRPPASSPLPMNLQLQTALRVQLARAMHHVHVASLRKTGVFTFPFAPPVAGT